MRKQLKSCKYRTDFTDLALIAKELGYFILSSLSQGSIYQSRPLNLLLDPFYLLFNVAFTWKYLVRCGLCIRFILSKQGLVHNSIELLNFKRIYVFT